MAKYHVEGNHITGYCVLLANGGIEYDLLETKAEADEICDSLLHREGREMSAVEIIEPSEGESCCSCNTDNVLLHKWTDDDQFRDVRTHQHCDLCYETDFGTRCGNRFSGYGDAMDIMRHMTQLEHIRNRGGH